MKNSLICTIYNEGNNLKGLLDSITKQTEVPDEVIFVDAGSDDNTIKILKSYKKKIKKLKIFVEDGVNIAEGRNIAIEKASGDVILGTDGGCILDKDWVKNIMRNYPEYDVVAGTYEPLARNDFEYFQGISTVPPREEQGKISRMSSRSISFKKSAWKKVGGYPEGTYTGEDTLFNIKLKEAGFKLKSEKEAFVKWHMRPTWKSFAKQFYLYGKGDRKAGNLMKMKSNLLLSIGVGFYTLALLGSIFNWIYFLAVLSPLILYSIFVGLEYLLKTKKIKSLFYCPLLNIVKRFAYGYGTLLG